MHNDVQTTDLSLQSGISFSINRAGDGYVPGGTRTSRYKQHAPASIPCRVVSERTDKTLLICYVLGVASLASTLNSGLVFTEIDEGGGETCPVGDAGEQEFRSLVQLVFEALLSDFENIGDVGHTEEVFHIVQPIGLRVRVSKFSVDLGFTKSLAGHL